MAFATYIDALVLHALSHRGSLGHHLRMISSTAISDAAAQARRSHLHWPWFRALFARVFRPLADARQHPGCFHRGLRLLALDGSSWSLPNTAAITATVRKPANQKGRSGAFPKFMSCVLLELGTHQPLAAECEQGDQAHPSAELTLAKTLLPQLPQKERSLLLADRLYGCPSFIAAVQDGSGGQCEVLLRVQQRHRARIIEVLADGSALVEVTFRQTGSPGKKTTPERKQRLREIRFQVQRPKNSQAGQKAGSGGSSGGSELRLWTTLLDAVAHPAQELAALYAQRWEAELFFREIKTHAQRSHLLRSGSLQGAQAEFGALMMAAHLLAAQRLESAQAAELPPVRLSLVKIAHLLGQVVPMLALGQGILSEAQQRALIAKWMKLITREARLPPRRARSCPRGLRKPNTDWPRIHQRWEARGSSSISLLPFPFP